MKNKITINPLMAFLLVTSALIMSACEPDYESGAAPKIIENSAENILTTSWTPDPNSPCPANAEWITKPSLPIEVASSDTNCDFHQFMWQSLLYLVQPVSSGSNTLNFETWMPSYGIFVAEGEKPAAWDTVPNPSYCASTDSEAKAGYIFSNLTLQAGSHHPLIDQQGEDVFYNISVNKKAYDFITGCDLYKAQCALTLAPDLLKPSGTAVVNIPKDYPNLAFPDESIELKTSWKVLTTGEIKSKTFYTTQGSVSSKDQCQVNVTLGLIGIHIVTKTSQHPEFIWATFEHKNNAPDCNNLQAKAPSASGWTFYNENCTENCTTNEYTAGSPTQVCRMHPWGDPTIGTFPNGLNCDSVPPPNYICDSDVQKYIINPNTKNLKALDASVTSLLNSSGNNNAIWSNYVLVGNVWTLNGALPPNLQVQRGSLSDANTTMETFVQNGEANVTNPNNCFSCHNLVGKSPTTSTTDASQKVQLPPAGVSHIFNLLNIETTGCSNGTALPSPTSCPNGN